jgi:2'-5' RNA ligase
VLDGEPLDSVPMSVDRVTIYQSRLGRGEATYSVVEEVGL